MAAPRGILRKKSQERFFWQRMAPPHKGKSMAWAPLWPGAMPCDALRRFSNDPPLPPQPPLGKAQQQQHQEYQRQIPQILGLARGHSGFGKGNAGGEFSE